MENLNDLKAIWHSLPLKGLANSTEMVQMIKKERKEKLKKLSLIMGAALLLIALMLILAFLSSPSLISTKIGIALMMLAGILMAATNLNSLNRFYNLKVCSNKDYIAFLKQTKLRQLFYFKKTQPLVMFCAAVGLFLFWHELTLQYPIIEMAIYVIFSIYFLLLWFYLRPKVFKKEQSKLNRSIEHINKISEQL